MHRERIGYLRDAIGNTWLLLVLLLLCSCDSGPPLGQVSGTVLLDGNPLPDARIIFQPQDGGPASHGETDAAGHYELIYAEGQPGAIVGPHRVSVETYRIRLNEAGEAEEHPELVPQKYNAQSELSREVTAGAQTIDFDLEND